MHEISLPPQHHPPQGLAHPLAAAALSLAWVIGRVVYTLGYSQGLPQKRLPGATLRSLRFALLTGGVDSGLGVPAFSLPSEKSSATCHELYLGTQG